ncbi:alpha-1,3-mannosyl-glycoprotein 2-beta-N-acetylglucosaminyltransferase [Chrysoperla carnea]|uniref:alpha-1,3-mannosyl-glycoprotein 2-beta-N-acetylglucosaminyltransferase n=1 Tax=Chrysoperla carnea TaxID=189513 RepID=UPI001D07113F|nr:alpha-1,3-mannosyl-glycoprotein 2-beta-N-acetylglucosaminyltransferase [Chrysoperla carnea]
MRIKRLTIFLLALSILFIWIVSTYIFFPTRAFNNEMGKMKHIMKQLDELEGGVSQIMGANKNILHEMASEYDLRIEKIKKATEKEISQDEKLKKLQKSFNGGPVIPVIVFACNRITVIRCLDQLIQYRPDPRQFPIIVSQDCNDLQTKNAINTNYGDKLTLIEQPDQSDIQVPPKEKKFKGYFKIARHYGWALNQTFFKYNFDTAIIVEDDLDIAPDFFEYFVGTYYLLKHDPTLWCISAWNDNGKSNLVDMENGASKLYRTDFFPGLGWMLTKELWTELAPKWPKAYWDDWIRRPEQRKDRACIRPEISRTRTFGKYGVSNGLFYEKHLKYIQLNDKFVPFSKMDLTYLLKNYYDEPFLKEVYDNSIEVSYHNLRTLVLPEKQSIRIPYTKETYKKAARAVGLMDDFKSGVPRTGYRGIITFHWNGRTAYLAPPRNWNGYDPSWS